jgi:ABC-type lipoprotein release transport system permease subunit
MKIFLLVLIVIIVVIADIIPLIRKKQQKEAAILLILGAVTLSYGCYYITHEHTASLANLMFSIFSSR